MTEQTPGDQTRSEELAARDAVERAQSEADAAAREHAAALERAQRDLASQLATGVSNDPQTGVIEEVPGGGIIDTATGVDPNRAIVHAPPLPGGTRTLCCDVEVAELPANAVLSTIVSRVSCPGAAAVPVQQTSEHAELVAWLRAVANGATAEDFWSVLATALIGKGFRP